MSFSNKQTVNNLGFAAARIAQGQEHPQDGCQGPTTFRDNPGSATEKAFLHVRFCGPKHHLRFFELLDKDFADLEVDKRFISRDGGADESFFRVMGPKDRLDFFSDRLNAVTEGASIASSTNPGVRFEIVFEAPERVILFYQVTQILREHSINMERLESATDLRNNTFWTTVHIQICVPEKKLPVMPVVEQQFRELGRAFFRAVA